jgi:hypothetical protein
MSLPRPSRSKGYSRSICSSSRSSNTVPSRVGSNSKAEAEAEERSSRNSTACKQDSKADSSSTRTRNRRRTRNRSMDPILPCATSDALAGLATYPR